MTPVEIGHKVKIDSEGYVGPAYIREWHARGAYVSTDRFGDTFFARFKDIVELR